MTQEIDDRPELQTVALLREASKEIRRVAEAPPEGWFEKGDPDLRAALASRYHPQALPVPSVAAFIEAFSPQIALAVADWLDGEAAVLGEIGPFVELIGAVIENGSGPIGRMSIVRDGDGQFHSPAMSTPAAERLARLILGRPEEV